MREIHVSLPKKILYFVHTSYFDILKVLLIV